jgi:N-acyl-D-aspartate/D-glutamate deacylase
MDIGTQIAHGPVRAYVMGKRGAKNEPATPEGIAGMAAVVKEAIAAGALGFSTSRTIFHQAVDGEPVPGTYAAEDELFGIGRVLGELDMGLFEVAPAGAMGEDLSAPAKEVSWMRRLAAEIRRPVTFALLQHDVAKEQWRELMRLSNEAADEGSDLRPQVTARASTLLIGFQTAHPFRYKPTYKKLAELPLPERIVALRDPEVRRRILSEESVGMDPRIATVENIILQGLHRMFPLGDPPDYEPSPETSIKAIAEQKGLDPFEVLYDVLLELDGKQLVMLTLVGYSDGNFDALREMLETPRSVFGLGDGGAHCGSICDASMPTSLISHWARDRKRGAQIPLERAVRKMTQDTAALYGLLDRGVVAPGKKADLNVIDFDRLQLELPEVAYDLPAGAMRILQKARGYEATIVSGIVTLREGEHTGALPGRLVRGAQHG